MIKTLVGIVSLLVIQGCATMAASDTSSRLASPYIELKNFDQVELVKSDNDLSINGVNYHLFLSKEILQERDAFIIVPYDDPHPKWNDFCKIIDNPSLGKSIPSAKITWNAHYNRNRGEIFVQDVNFEGDKCVAIIDVSWNKRSRFQYLLSAVSLHVLAIPIDLVTLPVQIILFVSGRDPF